MVTVVTVVTVTVVAHNKGGITFAITSGTIYHVHMERDARSDMTVKHVASQGTIFSHVSCTPPLLFVPNGEVTLPRRCVSNVVSPYQPPPPPLPVSAVLETRTPPGVINPVVNPVINPVNPVVINPVVNPVNPVVITPVVNPVDPVVINSVVNPVGNPGVIPGVHPVVRPVVFNPVVKPVVNPVVNHVVNPVPPTRFSPSSELLPHPPGEVFKEIPLGIENQFVNIPNLANELADHPDRHTVQYVL